jgi:hypothetical protein
MTEKVLIAVSYHDRTQRETHDEKGEWLQAIQITHEFPPEGPNRLTQSVVHKTDYSIARGLQF